MKLGPFDGNPEEVTDLLVNNGLKLEDLFERPPEPLKTRYIVIPVTIFVVLLLVILAFGDELPKVVVSALSLFSFGFGVWLTVSIQIRFCKFMVTSVLAMGLMLMLLIAAGVFSLQDTANFIKEFRKKP